MLGFVSPPAHLPQHIMASAVNWSQVLKRCRPDIHKKIIDTRGRHEELRRMIGEAAAAMPKIDFSKYRAALPASSHKFVDEMEGMMNGFQVNKIDTAPLIQALDAEKSAKMTEARQYLEKLEKQIGELREKLTMLKNSKPVDELTVDDVYEMRPELKESFQKSLANDNWATVTGDAAKEEKKH